jgi:hypothetical protein
MHQNTTPEPRVNKLGHTVTKHVKPQTPNALPLFNVPAPSVRTGNHREARADRIVDEIGNAMVFDRFSESPLSPEDMKVKLMTFSARTLEVTEAAIAWNRQRYLPNAVELFLVIKDHSEKRIREFMVCRPQMDESSIDPTSDNFRAIQGLHNIDYFKGYDLSALDEHMLGVARAFLRVTAALDEHDLDSVDYENDDHSINIHDKELQDLIVAHPDKTDEITSFIADRKTGNAALIRAYIENGTALREGTL